MLASPWQGRHSSSEAAAGPGHRTAKAATHARQVKRRLVLGAFILQLPCSASGVRPRWLLVGKQHRANDPDGDAEADTEGNPRKYADSPHNDLRLRLFQVLFELA